MGRNSLDPHPAHRRQAACLTVPHPESLCLSSCILLVDSQDSLRESEDLATFVGKVLVPPPFPWSLLHMRWRQPERSIVNVVSCFCLPQRTNGHNSKFEFEASAIKMTSAPPGSRAASQMGPAFTGEIEPFTELSVHKI